LLCDHVTGCPARSRVTSAVSSPRSTSNTELRLTKSLSGFSARSTYHDHSTVPTMSGARSTVMAYESFEVAYVFCRRKKPVMKVRKMRTPQMSRTKVMGQAWPWDS
jgi:hypothetical protein